MLRPAVAGMLLLALPVAGQQDTIQADPVFGGGFLLTLNTTHENIEQARIQMEPRARALCKDKSVRWGRYQFDAEAIVVPPGQPARTRMTLRQQITCEADSPLRPAPPPGRTPEASTADRQAIERINAAFFAAKDRGDAEASWRMAGDRGLASFSSLAAWRERLGQFVEAAGGGVRRDWRKWTWYRDPEGAEPGLYVAVDFVGDSRNLAALCGYAVWRRRANGNFDLLRLEENVISREEITRFRPDELEATLKRFRCK